MILSRDTLAMMDAAAMERLRESPLIMVSWGMMRGILWRPSMRR